MLGWLANWLKTRGFGQPAPAKPADYDPLPILRRRELGFGEYMIRPARRVDDERWIIVYRNPVDGFENDPVDGLDYPSFEAAAAALVKIVNPSA